MFMTATRPAVCQETGRKINPGDFILKDLATKRVYCNKSKMFKDERDRNNMVGSEQDEGYALDNFTIPNRDDFGGPLWINGARIL